MGRPGPGRPDAAAHPPTGGSVGGGVAGLGVAGGLDRLLLCVGGGWWGVLGCSARVGCGVGGRGFGGCALRVGGLGGFLLGRSGSWFVIRWCVGFF